MCRIVLFDLDGTLLDTSGLIMSSLRHAVRVAGGDPRPLDDFTWGRPLRDVLRELCDGQEHLAFAAYQDHYRAHLQMVSLFPGMRAVIEALRQTDCRLAVVTNKGYEPARRDLARHGLEAAFPVVVGREQVDHAKPHPEPILMALRLLQEAPQAAADAIMLGDTPWDMMAGKAAGALTGGVLWGPDPVALRDCGQADYLFASPAQLEEWFQENLPL